VNEIDAKIVSMVNGEDLVNYHMFERLMNGAASQEHGSYEGLHDIDLVMFLIKWTKEIPYLEDRKKFPLPYNDERGYTLLKNWREAMAAYEGQYKKKIFPDAT
jgi:hypothetical protein